MISEDNVTKRRTSMLSCSKSKISKRMLPENKSLARIMQIDLTKSLSKERGDISEEADHHLGGRQ